MADKRIPTAVYCRTTECSESAIVDQIQLVERLTGANESLDLKETYIDYGKTGLDMKRPAWNRLITDCKKGKIKCIVTTQLLVLGQALAENPDFFIETFTSMNVRVIAFLDGVDTGDPDFDFAKRYVKGRKLNFNDRVRTIQTVDMEEGRVASKVAYGYMKQADALIIDKEKAETVIQIYQWFLTGTKISQIAEWLTESKIKSPSGASKWSQTTISRILRDSTYCGSYERGKRRRSGDGFVDIPEVDRHTFDNHHEAIISQDDFDKVQILLNNHKRTVDVEKVAAHPDEVDGFFFCALCGKKINYRRPGGNDGVVTGNYYCRYHTGAKAAGDKLDHAPSITEQNLKEQLLIRCNDRLQELRDDYEKWFSEPEEVNEEERRLRKLYRAKLYERVIEAERLGMGLLEKSEYDKKQMALCGQAYQILQELHSIRGRTMWDEYAYEQLHRFIVEVAGEDLSEFDGAKVRRLIDIIKLNPDGSIEIAFAKEKELQTVRKMRAAPS